MRCARDSVSGRGGSRARRVIVGVVPGNVGNELFFGGWYKLSVENVLSLDALFHNLGNVTSMGVLGAVGGTVGWNLAAESREDI